MFRKPNKQTTYHTILKLAVGLTDPQEIADRIRLVDLHLPDNLDKHDVAQIIAKAARVQRQLVAAAPPFRRDDILYGNEPAEVIELMITQQHSWGTSYLARCIVTSANVAKLVYGRASWDHTAGQFRSGKWFAGGRSFASFCYVVDWKDTP